MCCNTDQTVENDGYSAVQVGFGDKKEKVVEKDANGKKSVAHRHGVNKAQMGHFKKQVFQERDSFASSNSKTQMSTI